jgi:flagellar basal body-associated protein FliL
MNNRKKGKIFIVLMISLIAFGFGSCVYAVNGSNDFINGLIPITFPWNASEQISTIGDSSFAPTYIIKHFYNNTTNTTNNTTNITNNITIVTNNTKPVNNSKNN